MKYENLTSQQKAWMVEIQRYFTIRDNMDLYGRRLHVPNHPRIIADTETGEVFETFEGDEFQPMGILRKLGKIPLKAIPFRHHKDIRVKEVTKYEISGALR
jgi:hypothetical protein